MNKTFLNLNRYLSAKAKLSLLTFLLISILSSASAQTPKADFKWWNPAKNDFLVLQNQGWNKTDLKNYYDRLPAKAENTVRKAVWSLSRNAAGLKIIFNSNAEDITVRYVLANRNYAMDHFPATGVSGVDLYAKNNDGSWAWATGKYSFKDTVTYTYTNLNLNKEKYKNGREFHLYLPLYNSVVWMEIGVGKDKTFNPLPVSKEKPIVVYGTSIAQGGCASRPGMAWTNILNRSLNQPIINLGFSGNGKLEKEVVDLLLEIDAKMFIIDCIPNMSDNATQIKPRLLSTVKALKAKYPNTPIVLSDHSGFINNRLDGVTTARVKNANKFSKEAFEELKAQKVSKIYYLPTEKINLGTEDTVDGAHPTDFGMYKNAKAYEEIIRTILK
jgi:hypothetical protein